MKYISIYHLFLFYKQSRLSNSNFYQSVLVEPEVNELVIYYGIFWVNKLFDLLGITKFNY